ncbi:centromere protein X, partial [Balearica regulorum gibbericeps]|uniref:centromere protein X n=1 Tax=Balearica regulorum gibbericeps TaxID=100784 RepID=UPI003F5D6F31
RSETAAASERCGGPGRGGDSAPGCSRAAHPLSSPRRRPWTGCSASTSGTGGPERFVVAVNGDAQLLMAEMLNVFVREAAARAARQAQAEDLEKVDIEHVEKVLPQLLLDF